MSLASTGTPLVTASMMTLAPPSMSEAMTIRSLRDRRWRAALWGILPSHWYWGLTAWVALAAWPSADSSAPPICSRRALGLVTRELARMKVYGSFSARRWPIMQTSKWRRPGPRAGGRMVGADW